MPSPISQSQFDKLRALVDKGRIHTAYDYLADRGYYYACWACGDGADNLPPDERVNAVPGLGPEARQKLTAHELARFRASMAKGYLEALRRQFAQGPAITRDVSAEETAEFHGEVFRTHFIGIKDWTLQVPFELQEKAGGLEAVERYWQGVLRTSARLSARAVARSAAAMAA
ncbi:MAG: hypothetical protein EOP82_29990 [Variovorax sp.]|nr:MAG: hypothetical protein EOP82_29990 [Variovorax sp.]